MPHDIPPEIADADTADLKEQPTESPYQKLGEYFLMDASQRAAALTELAAADTATRQRVQDAQLLRGLAEGKLFMKGTEEGDAFLHNQTVKDPDAIAYLISLLEETPGVPQEGKQSQHTQLTMHLTRVNEGIAEAKEAAERPRTVTGLPMRGQPRPPRTEFGTNVSESGVDTFLAHRAGPTDPQDHTNTK